MARKRSATLTDAELRLMDVLWRMGHATVAEVNAALAPPPLAYNTVLTTLRILERKGYVAHDADGRAFVYRALLARDDAAKRAVGNLVQRFFRNSPGALALRLVADERPSDDELRRLRSLIERYEEDLR
ncbi:MAG: BlaI/MecI/CopY family transcriptional regulator [Vulcanimicrobiaceae bacterium]